MKSDIILSLVSGGLIAAGTYLWQKASNLIRYGKKTDAIVFDNKKEYSSNDTIYYHPIVRFKTEDNKEFAHEVSIGYDTPTQIGTVIRIVYDPDDPATAEIDSRTMLELIPRVLVVAGLCGLVLVLFEVFEITNLME